MTSKEKAEKLGKDFLAFAMKGNVMDLAVGVMIGGAFGKIVSSLVSDVVMPLISLLTGGIDLTGMFLALDFKEYPNIEAAKAAGGKPLPEAMAAVLAGAEKGVEASRTLMSQHGKAAVFREKTIGLEDPGCVAFCLMVRGFAGAVATR